MTVLSLRLRLALFGGLALAAALALAGYGLSSLFGVHVERRALGEMEIQLEQVLAGLSRGTAGLAVATPPTDPRFTRPYGGRYWQLAVGEQVLRSRSLWDATLPVAVGTAPEAAAHLFRGAGPGGVPLLGMARVFDLPPSLGGGLATVSVAMDAGELRQAQRDFTAELSPYLVLLGAVLLAGQIVQLTYGLRPLRRIGEHVAALRAGRQARMGGNWPREMQPLAGEIDGLLDARDAALDRARFRAADLAHGLKTPLQALLGEAGRLRDRGEAGAARAIEDVAGAMQAHVERELSRSRLAPASGQAGAGPAEVSGRIVDVLRRTPRGEAVDWEVEVPADAVIAIDPADLAEAVGALAENALRHARGRVAITFSSADGRGYLQVEDDGPGIPEAALEAVLQRGGRLDESGPGAGLGLAIASDIAAAAGGRLVLANGTQGCRAVLELPLRS